MLLLYLWKVRDVMHRMEPNCLLIFFGYDKISPKLGKIIPESNTVKAIFNAIFIIVHRKVHAFIFRNEPSVTFMSLAPWKGHYWISKYLIGRGIIAIFTQISQFFRSSVVHTQLRLMIEKLCILLSQLFGNSWSTSEKWKTIDYDKSHDSRKSRFYPINWMKEEFKMKMKVDLELNK